jgi:hypothetical protein
LPSPYIRGVGAGQQLDVQWPGEVSANPRNLSGYTPTAANALLMFAWLFPRELEDHLLAIIMAAADEPIPLQQRPA